MSIIFFNFEEYIIPYPMQKHNFANSSCEGYLFVLPKRLKMKTRISNCKLTGYNNHS